MIKNYIAPFIAYIVGYMLVSFLLSYPLMLLWNYCLVDAVTVINPVTWLQMWGIGFLIACLIKSGK